MLDKINIDEIKPSSRGNTLELYLKIQETLGDQILNVENLSYKNEDVEYIS